MKIQIKKEISGDGRDNSRIPKWYGLAYRAPDRYTLILYPIPLNIVIGLALKVYLKFRCPEFENIYNKAHDHGYSDGYKVGREDGYSNGSLTKNNEIIDQIDKIKKALSELKESNG